MGRRSSQPRKAWGAIAAAIAAPAWAAIASPAGITPRLAPAATEEPAFMLRAEGARVFECKPLADETGRYAWTLLHPEADLYDAGRIVGRQLAGPTWEATGDRSSVSGTLRSREDRGGGVPWALYRGTSAGESGLFAGVTSVQRVNTSGPPAPQAACDATRVGEEARVAFAADYYFYRPRAG